MIEAGGEEGDSDEEKETEPPAECPAHKTTTKRAKGVMTDDEIVANCFGFLFAGGETTATTLSFASYILALNPDIQEKLQSEIDAFFEDEPVSNVATNCTIWVCLSLFMVAAAHCYCYYHNIAEKFH